MEQQEQEGDEGMVRAVDENGVELCCEDDVEVTDSSLGTFGGYCTCPSGAVKKMAGNKDYLGFSNCDEWEAHCEGGTAMGTCDGTHGTQPWSKKKTTCGECAPCPTPSPTPAPTVSTETASAAQNGEEEARTTISDVAGSMQNSLSEGEFEFNQVASDLNVQEEASEALVDLAMSNMDSTREALSDLKFEITDANGAVKYGRKEFKDDIKFMTSLLGKNILEYWDNMRTARKDAKDAMMDTRENILRDWKRASWGARREIKNLRSLTKKEIKKEYEDKNVYRNEAAMAKRGLIAVMKQKNQKRKIAEIEKSMNDLIKRSEKAISKAKNIVTKQMKTGSKKVYDKVANIVGRFLSSGNRDLDKKREKLVSKAEKRVARDVKRSERRSGKTVKRLNKVMKTLGKEFERDNGMRLSQQEALESEMTDLQNTMKDALSDDDVTEEEILRLDTAVPAATAESAKGQLSRVKEIVTAAREKLSILSQQMAGALEKGKLTSNDAVSQEIDTLRAAIRKDSEDLTKVSLGTTVKVRDATGKTKNSQLSLAAKMEADAGELQKAFQTTGDVIGQVKLSNKRLTKAQMDGANLQTATVKNFIQQTAIALQQLDRKIKQIASPDGQHSPNAAVKAGLHRLAQEMLGQLEREGDSSRKTTEDMGVTLQEAILGFTSKLTHAEQVMGVGQKSDAQSMFQFVTADLPATMQAVFDGEVHERGAAYTAVEKGEQTAQQWAETVKQQASILAGQSRSFTQNAVNQHSQELEEAVGKRQFDDTEIGDAIQRASAAADEKESSAWKSALDRMNIMVAALADAETQIQAVQHAASVLQNDAQNSKVQESAVVTREHQIRAMAEKMRSQALNVISAMLNDAQAVGEKQLLRQQDADASQTNSLKGSIREFLATQSARMEKDVFKIKGVAKDTKGTLGGLLQTIGGIKAMRGANLKDLRNARIKTEEKGQGVSMAYQKELAALTAEQSKALSDAAAKLSTVMHGEHVASKAQEQAMLRSFATSMDRVESAGSAFFKTGEGKLSAELGSFKQRDAVLKTSRENAAAGALAAADTWKSTSTDSGSQLLLTERKAKSAADTEGQEVEGLSRDEDMNAKRMGEGAKTMGTVLQDGGDKAAEALVQTEEQIKSEAELARIAEDSATQDIRAETRIGAEKLDRADTELAFSMGKLLGSLGTTEAGLSRTNALTKTQSEEIAKLVGVENGASADNKNYLKTYAVTSAAQALEILTYLISAQMTMVRQNFVYNNNFEKELNGIGYHFNKVTGGAAFKALQSVAQADEDAITIAANHEKLEYWIEQFEKQEKDFQGRVEQGFIDQDALEKMTRAELAQDREEQKKAALKSQEMLDGKVNGMLKEVGVGFDASVLDDALGESMYAMTDLGKTRAQADNAVLDNLQGVLDREGNQADQDVTRTQGELSAIGAEKMEAAKTLSTMSNMIDMIQRSNEKKMKAMKSLMNDRAAQFSEALLLGSSSMKEVAPDVHELKDRALKLKGDHDALAKRHGIAENNLQVLMNKIHDGLEATVVKKDGK